MDESCATMVSEVEVIGKIVLNSHGGFYDQPIVASQTNGSFFMKGKDIKQLNRVVKQIDCSICEDSSSSF
jgi:hypothetical protein